MGWGRDYLWFDWFVCFEIEPYHSQSSQLFCKKSRVKMLQMCYECRMKEVKVKIYKIL